jgi:3-methyladenine DNA glycosylase AlkD
VATKKKQIAKKAPDAKSVAPVAERVASVVASLKRAGSGKVRDGMARYAIPNDRAFGIAVGALRTMGKQLGPDHALAEALWKTGFYEARLLAVFVDEPARVSPAQMDRWCRDFDNWAVCDTACFHLFDRTPHVFDKVARWAERKPEFEKRAAFALLASSAGHDKGAPDAAFQRCFPLIERGAEDPRNFVKKAVSWALRRIGTRSDALKSEALALAKKLVASENPAARWVGKDAVRDLSRVSKPRAKEKR